jgi:hypothetical protein
METMTSTPQSRAPAWVERFEGLLLETMPHLRRAAPGLTEEQLLETASRLVELRLGGLVDLGSDIR